jgi:hypothetical protein
MGGYAAVLPPRLTTPLRLIDTMTMVSKQQQQQQQATARTE